MKEMKKYNIDINEFIKHLVDAGATITEGEGRLLDNGVEVDLGKLFKDAFEPPALDFSMPSKRIELDFDSGIAPQRNYPLSNLLVA